MFDTSPALPTAGPLKLMVILGSVRPRRAGLSVALWAYDLVSQAADIEIDFVDLAELNLPFMDEPGRPEDQRYTKRHTKAWSARVDAAEAFLFITPEYNNSYSPVLKNALDYLHHEWSGKPVGVVGYGGHSGGTRGVAALRPVLDCLRLVSTPVNLTIPYVDEQLKDGDFIPYELQRLELCAMLDGLRALRSKSHTATRASAPVLR